MKIIVQRVSTFPVLLAGLGTVHPFDHLSQGNVMLDPLDNSPELNVDAQHHS
jgi:hypothetical protein